MSKSVVIVESPTKVRTIKKYLGDEYDVVSTVGHIRDLPKKEIGIDIEDGFKPKYTMIPGKQKVVQSLKKAATNATDIYLAPDPDREGEAIAYHTAEVLKKKGRRFHRVLFHELTPTGIVKAMDAPIELNLNKYNAQQTRRILDRLVGYQISPLLWRKVKGGLSAGRVQSVALRIICERERAIHAFEPEEYWSITVHLSAETPPSFTAKLTKKSGKKISIGKKEEADSILAELKKSDFEVDKIQQKTIKRNPLPPFTTSKLQQESIRKLRFTASKTMMIAQQLYEGVELEPGEPVGLITYMRTDSTRIAQESAEEAISLIREQFGPEFAMDAPRYFKNKNKVQDAHEAIRPTSVFNTPDMIKSHLSQDQLALYTLIWKRFVASQMKQALVDQMSIRIKSLEYTFQASGSSIRFPGFMSVYLSVDDERDGKDKSYPLPPLAEGMILKKDKLDPKQHFTAPPPRFSEASLVKELEENGIGRPSTYASILSTIRGKGYVDFLNRQFRPTELGFIVCDLLVNNFPDVFDVEFTAKMEDNLDKIEASKIEAKNILDNFYKPFKGELDKATDHMLSIKGVGVPTDLICPECKGQIHIKMGKNGHFLACNQYPDCKYTRNYERDEKGIIQPIEPMDMTGFEKDCPLCGEKMVAKQGRYGQFLACSGYPDCKHTESIQSPDAPNATGIQCPKKDCDGVIVERKSKRGKTFYGCNRYPDCDFAIWDRPVPEECPACEAPFLVEKSSKKEGDFFTCLTKGCGYKKKK